MRFLTSLFSGEKNVIIWSFAYEDKNTGAVNWCSQEMKFFESKNDTCRVPLPVSGDTSVPFLLVTFPMEKPDLRAVGLEHLAQMKIKKRFCVHFAAELEEWKQTKHPLSVNNTLAEIHKDFLSITKYFVQG
jgi:hypothetical protein